MTIACSVPVDAGRAGRRWLALARAVPAFGMATLAGLLVVGPPSWASAEHPLFWSSMQLICALASLYGGVRAVQALRLHSSLAGSRPPRMLHLGQEGLARLSSAASAPPDAPGLRLSRVSELPGLIVVVLTPISRDRPKLSPWWRSDSAVETVLIAQDAVSQDQWRRLHVWLVWVQRGRLSKLAP